MDTETELIQKYEHVLTTVREQIRGLKTRISGRRTERKRDSPMRGNSDQDIARVEFKEELVRKEFELEECLLELDELKTELKRQKESPFQVATSPPDEEEGEPQPTTNPAYPSWEDLPVREDLSRGSMEEDGQQDEDAELLRKKMDVIERENRVLREKADLYDCQIQSLQTRLQQSLKQGLLRRSQYPEEARTSIQNLRREVKDELNRELTTPQSTRLQKKIELLQESVLMGSGDDMRRRNDDFPRAKSPPKRSNVSAIAQQLLEKETAIQDMTTRLDTLTEEYQTMVDSKAAKEKEQEKELETLRKTLEERENALEEVKKQVREMEERFQTMAKAMSGHRPDSQPVEATGSRLETDPDYPQKFATDVSQGPSPDPRPMRQTTPSAIKPLVGTVKEALGRQSAAPTQAKTGLVGKLAGAMKGKAGAARTPR